MIAMITGELITKTAPMVLIDVQGVGYELEVPMSTFYELPEVGTRARLYTHFVVREDAQLLFGFHDTKSRDLFRVLIKISGVGPKMAVAMMSTLSVAELVAIVNEGSVARLVKVPGVGKKTAERLLIELKDKLKSFAPTSSPSGSQPTIEASNDQLFDEAQSALLALGYKNSEAEKLVAQAWKQAEYNKSQDLIRAALKLVAK